MATRASLDPRPHSHLICCAQRTISYPFIDSILPRAAYSKDRWNLAFHCTYLLCHLSQVVFGLQPCFSLSHLGLWHNDKDSARSKSPIAPTVYHAGAATVVLSPPYVTQQPSCCSRVRWNLKSCSDHRQLVCGAAPEPAEETFFLSSPPKTLL